MLPVCPEPVEGWICDGSTSSPRTDARLCKKSIATKNRYTFSSQKELPYRTEGFIKQLSKLVSRVLEYRPRKRLRFKTPYEVFNKLTDLDGKMLLSV